MGNGHHLEDPTTSGDVAKLRSLAADADGSGDTTTANALGAVAELGQMDLDS